MYICAFYVIVEIISQFLHRFISHMNKTINTHQTYTTYIMGHE